MKLKKAVLLGGILWIALVSLLHAWLNLGVFRKVGPQAATTLKVGFLPVT